MVHEISNSSTKFLSLRRVGDVGGALCVWVEDAVAEPSFVVLEMMLVCPVDSQGILYQRMLSC